MFSYWVKASNFNPFQPIVAIHIGTSPLICMQIKDWILYEMQQ